MAIQIKHAFTSLKGDGGDATLIRPSNWNALHTTSMATQMLIGRLTAGAGVFEEIPLTTYMASLLAAVDNATLAAALGIFETGDVKFTLRTTATTGWLKLNGGNLQANTIGSAGSGAVLRANADTLPLYQIIWDACSNTEAPIYDSGGSASTRGANAAADFSANKRLAIPNPVGKAIVGAGAANTAGLITSSRTLGSVFGGETATLVTSNLPPYTPAGSIANGAITINNQGSLRAISDFNNNGGGGGAFGAATSNGVGLTASQAASTFTGTAQGGTSAPFSITQASVALNVLVKL